MPITIYPDRGGLGRGISKVDPSGNVQFPAAVRDVDGAMAYMPHRKRPATFAPHTGVVTGKTAHDSRTAWFIGREASCLYFVFRNFLPFNASVFSNERDYIDASIGDITVSFSIEVGGTYFVDGIFANGSRSVVIPPGGEAICRVVGPFSAGSTYFGRTHIDCAADKYVPVYNTLSPNTGYLFDAASAVRSTGVSAYTINATTPVYGPVAVYLDKRISSILGFGDSILQGSGDISPNTSYGQYAAGWFRRWTNGKIGADAMTLPGATLNTLTSTWGFCESTHQSFADKMASAHLIAFGANDCLTKSFATITSQYTDFIAKLRANGASKIIVPKILPRTSSTDSWATTTNQTPATGFEVGGVRDQVNVWIADNTGPGKLIDVMLDTTAYVEAAGNRWVAARTSDGVHPNSTAHAAIASGLPSPVTIAA